MLTPRPQIHLSFARRRPPSQPTASHSASRRAAVERALWDEMELRRSLAELKVNSAQDAARTALSAASASSAASFALLEAVEAHMDVQQPIDGEELRNGALHYSGKRLRLPDDGSDDQCLRGRSAAHRWRHL